MTKIKLLEVEVLKDGTKRLQSQLWVGRDAADFIIDPDGIIKVLTYGAKGENFYPFNGEYEIVASKIDMVSQGL